MLLGVGYSQSEYDDCEELNDGQFNVLDVVVLANCILSGSTGNPCSNEWLCDVNIDGSINVLDVVILVNCILANNCSG